MSRQSEREKDEVAVRKWMDRISVACKFREQKANEYGWERLINEFKGKYDIAIGSRKGPIKILPINKVFAFVESDKALMLFKDPYIAVNPKSSGTAKGAALLEATVNDLWKTLEIKEENELTLTDSDLVGHGWTKTGVSVKTEGDEDDLRVQSQLFSMFVSWKDIVFNVGAMRPPKDCYWMAHRIVRPISQLKEMYPQLASLKGQKSQYVNERDYNNALYKDDIEVGVLWEIWDKLEQRTYLIADGYMDGFLKKGVWPKYQKNFPFRMLGFYRAPEEAYPLSPVGIIEPQILEQNKIFAQALNHVKRWNRQAFAKRGTIGESALDQFEEGIDGQIIETDGDPNIKFADFGQLPSDIYAILDRIAGYEREIGGQPEFQRGGTTRAITRTFKELELISEGSKGRHDKKIDALETHMEQVASDLLAHFKANFDVEFVANVSGETPESVVKAFESHYDPITKTIRFTAEDIIGDYEVEVKAGSTLPMNKEARTATLRTILELAMAVRGPLPAFLREIISELLSDFKMPQIKAAFEEDQLAAADAQNESRVEGQVDVAKQVAEVAKKTAQADKIELENVRLKSEIDTPLEIMNALEQRNAQRGKR